MRLSHISFLPIRQQYLSGVLLQRHAFKKIMMFSNFISCLREVGFEEDSPERFLCGVTVLADKAHLIFAEAWAGILEPWL